METNQTANKYGVVSFETAKKLQWKEETIFLYLGTSQRTLEDVFDINEVEKHLKFRLCMPSVHKGEKFEHNNLYCFENEEEFPDFRRKGSQEFYYAPQMHEIAPLIPEKFTKDGVMYRLDLDLCPQRVYLRYQMPSKKEILFSAPIIDNNYAEAYAKLYLLLKENGYIK